YIGVRHAVAVSSGTSGLHLLARVLGIGREDEVLVPSFTFVASVNAILYEGARPVFVDIEPETYTLDMEDLRRKITPRTKAIMVVDTFGHPAEWDGLQEIADQYGLLLIDDACEALGAEYRGKKIGQFGDGAVFAFYPNKQITTGEGGMVVTNNPKVADLARSLRNQGRGKMSAWLEHEWLGYNYRMDEMSAALGVSQLRKIEDFLAKRSQVAEWYTQRLQGFEKLRTQVVKPYVRMSWFVYVVTLARGIHRDWVIREMGKEGIPARGYFPPVHLIPYIRKQFGFQRGELPVTEDIAERSLALPFHNRLQEKEVEKVVGVLREILGER
ncbi:MAG: DegT/DnrJ/EryC1/StrS family aminotransferase, partial [Candidatus Caldatribacteriaceae bacterium]